MPVPSQLARGACAHARTYSSTHVRPVRQRSDGSATSDGWSQCAYCRRGAGEEEDLASSPPQTPRENKKNTYRPLFVQQRCCKRVPEDLRGAGKLHLLLGGQFVHPQLLAVLLHVTAAADGGRKADGWHSKEQA